MDELLKLNADLSARAVVRSGEMGYQPCPSPTVWRKRLYLDGPAEAPHHNHPNGEEVFVIDGEFEDEDGFYPAGTWIHNPAESSHTVKSPKGAILYVRFGGIDEQ